MASGNHSVVVRHAYKQYTGGPPVLDNLDMTVPRASIYGLLGPSGCGKTTLLSCIAGMKHLDSGDICVLGGTPGSPQSGVPGPQLGYMPQENAVVGEFTVKEAVYYFGWIHGMEKRALSSAFDFLSELLQLPSSSRYLKHLSGGQLRRVSFASALIHTPELLVLDEPTVGLDPVMRSVIWQYLVDLTRRTHMTIIITTHYIEEAGQADVIGLLRGGRLLAESSPANLLSVYNMSSLEDVFLALSARQTSEQATPASLVATHRAALEAVSNGSVNSVLNESEEVDLVGHHLEKKHSRHCNGRSFTLHRVKAMALKNGIRISRHPGGIFYTLFFPVLELLAFYLAIGADPRGLRMAVVNEEMGNASTCSDSLQHHSFRAELRPDYSCVFSGFGCGFLANFDADRVRQVYYEDMDDAMRELRAARVIAVMHVSSNFSSALQERLDRMWSASDADIHSSAITVYVDTTNMQLANSLKTYFLDLFQDFAESVSVACDRPKNMIHVPVNFKNPVHGNRHPNYTTFMAPGVIISLIYFLSVSLTSTLLIMEKVDGIWERTLAAGATPVEIMTSYFISQMVQLLIQMLLVFVVAVFVFGFDIHKNVCLSIALVALQGMAGMTFGFLMSAVCEDIRTANYFSLAVFYPYLFCSGVLWPVEGMPTALRFMSYMMPGTLAIESFRNLIVKGWTMLEPRVFFGFVASFGWICVQIIACILVIKYKK